MTETMPRIEHVNLTVTNLERSFAFYQALLGFAIRWQGTAVAETGQVRAWHVGNDATYIAMFEAERVGTAPSDYGVAGFNHVCFEVDDLVVYRARLAVLGVTPHLEPTYSPGKRLYVYDPDGIEIELVTYR